MRHLYDTKDQGIIAVAKNCERRRCGHHELEHPLSTLDCLKDVVDSKDQSTNKHRYVIASQDGAVRGYMRKIPGIPLIYVSRSVMILEPMAESTEKVRLNQEKGKFKAGILESRGSKRKRQDDVAENPTPEQQVTKKRRNKGPKGPNPLSVKKPKKRETAPIPG
jgi:U3 small nucleolar RNA-associated protein 23